MPNHDGTGPSGEGRCQKQQKNKTMNLGETNFMGTGKQKGGCGGKGKCLRQSRNG